jgi:hypothetical protein
LFFEMLRNLVRAEQIAEKRSEFGGASYPATEE